MTLVIDIAAGLPRLYCDRPALVDALVNLLSNAYKYGGEPRQIWVTAHVDGTHHRVSVRDNGKGIARREHKRIFQKFYRVDDFLARKQDGSGLGLAIVQHVVKAHRGKVEVDSTLGVGTSFTFVLPVREPREQLLDAGHVLVDKKPSPGKIGDDQEATPRT